VRYGHESGGRVSENAAGDRTDHPVPVVIGTVTVGSPIGTSVITLPGVTSVTVSAVPPAFLTCRNVFGPGVNVSDAAAAV
jgi:hypothetical protein